MYRTDQYFVRSIPFFAPNLAFDDLIQVEIDDETLYFNDLIKPSNNSTLRVVFLIMILNVLKNINYFGVLFMWLGRLCR